MAPGPASSDRDLDVVGRIRAGTALGVVTVADPAAVAAEVAGAGGVTVVPDPSQLALAVAAARVRLAEVVVDRARDAEARLPTVARPQETEGDDDEADRAAADRQAVRFALVILLLALPAGVAVHVADGLWLASALPAGALLGLGAVVLAHRSAPGQPTGEVAAVEEPTGPVPDVELAPSVRVARAHLRRQEAAWKVSWWERDEVPPAVGEWTVQVPAGAPLTLVAADPGGTVDERALATMTATAPAAVRVVVLRAG